MQRWDALLKYTRTTDRLEPKWQRMVNMMMRRYQILTPPHDPRVTITEGHHPCHLSIMNCTFMQYTFRVPNPWNHGQNSKEHFIQAEKNISWQPSYASTAQRSTNTKTVISPIARRNDLDKAICAIQGNHTRLQTSRLIWIRRSSSAWVTTHGLPSTAFSRNHTRLQRSLCK